MPENEVADAQKTKEEAVADLKALRALLGQIDTATCQINLVKSAANPTIKNTRHLDATDELARQFRAESATSLNVAITNALADADGVSEFNFQAFADGRLAVLPIDKYLQVRNWLGKIPAADQVPTLSGLDNHVSQLKFTHMILSFAPEGEIVHLFRKASESRLTRKGVIATLTGGTAYGYVDPEKALIFDMQVDFFIWSKFIFILNYKKFEAILHFRAITESVAKSVFDALTKLLPVTDAVALEQVIFSGVRQLNKIAGLSSKEHIDKLDMKRIQEVIDKAALPITIELVNGVPTLNVDPSDPQHIKAYLHILADDYVRSMLTDFAYISGPEKDRLNEV
jgi:hypothetical protein